MALLLTACGGRAEVPQPLPTFEPSYDWALVADVTGDDPDAQVYRALRTGCDAGQQALNSTWDRLTGPREVLLFTAAVQMCRGDQAGALGSFQKASTYGWNGLGPDRNSARCAVYTALTVTLNQVAPAAVSCPAGMSPGFTKSASGVVDNPLTPENEAAPPAPPPVIPPTSSSRPPGTTTKPELAPTTTKPTPAPTTKPTPAPPTTKPEPALTTTKPKPAPTTTTKPKPPPASPNTTTKPKPQNPPPPQREPSDMEDPGGMPSSSEEMSSQSGSNSSRRSSGGSGGNSASTNP
ncbi:hypothetical protein [Pseudonocardia sp. NPDC049154]|uniref:hypothetical protein n=1 Tax=Pseudonocardia sp. NPDC049154 TaxID=3155501 RepID=UPI0033CDD7BE